MPMKQNQDLIAKLELAILNKDDTELFHGLVVECMQTLVLSDTDISSRFGMSRTSVRRWISGATSPHPAMRVPVYNYFIKLLGTADAPIEPKK